MRSMPFLGAAALALAIPAVALAQSAGTPAPDAAPGAAPATASETAPGAAVTAGLPVKDKTGAPIGTVADVKTDASGKKVATIRMGADTFAVDTAALAVDKGAATINATQAELKAMLPKKEPKQE